MPEVLTVATDGLLLLQVPPDKISDKEIVAPAHTVEGPVIAAGEVEPLTMIASVTYPMPHELITE